MSQEEQGVSSTVQAEAGSATKGAANPLPQAKNEPPRAFSHLRTVRVEEHDENDHVSNVAFLQWVQDVAHAHTNALGYTVEAYRAIGGVFVVQRHDIEYCAQTFAGDRLRSVTWVEEFKSRWCIRRTHILRIGDGALVAKADTTWLWLGLPEGRPLRIPKEVHEAFSADLDAAMRDLPYPGQP